MAGQGRAAEEPLLRGAQEGRGGCAAGRPRHLEKGACTLLALTAARPLTLLLNFQRTQDAAESTAGARSSSDFNATAFLQTVGKGASVKAVVEQVMNGSMMRVTLLPSLQSATIQLCGAQVSDSTRERPNPT